MIFIIKITRPSASHESSDQVRIHYLLSTDLDTNYYYHTYHHSLCHVPGVNSPHFPTLYCAIPIPRSPLCGPRILVRTTSRVPSLRCVNRCQYVQEHTLMTKYSREQFAALHEKIITGPLTARWALEMFDSGIVNPTLDTSSVVKRALTRFEPSLLQAIVLIDRPLPLLKRPHSHPVGRLALVLAWSPEPISHGMRES